ncbi:hypothetical protein [Nocardia donostiensis]|uniref:Uncharacterized protein n=1 Tax=Nocardia donostiensis TaxID=1538463 RepID=A0A1W0BEI1_9NOCA|nr:hypothetical protein [Nocardia donostiensis]ONM50600.1 hypothetical protein B0T46_01490 [Nocardia donostiensis]OQS20756.1 hypothetical protein B0T44_08975 [Nocardia donostiensis]
MSNETSAVPGILGTDLGISPDAVNARVYAQQNLSGAENLGTQLSHDGQDPPYITRMEHFEGIPHQEIYDKAQTMHPGVMQDLGDTYVEISNTLSGGLLGAHLAINRALSDGLEGEFATGAAEATKRFYDQATDVQEVIHNVGRRLKAAAYGAEVVKLSVQKPPSGTATGAPPGTATTDLPPNLAALGDAMLTVAAPSDASALERAKEEQRQLAIHVMNTVYKPTYQPAGEGVPTFVPVQAPGDNPTGPVPGSTTTSSSPGNNQPGPGSNTPGSPENGQPEGEQPGSEDPQTTAANTNQNSTGQNTQQTGTPTTTGTPTGDPQRNTTTTAGVPGVPSTPGRPSSPGGPGNNPQAPGPGRSIPGTPTAPGVPGAATPATPAAAATAAGRPMTGMPGMMSPGAARRGGDDENERKTPDYLITNREEELFGRQPGTVPEALGADAPANRPAEGSDYR